MSKQWISSSQSCQWTQSEDIRSCHIMLIMESGIQSRPSQSQDSGKSMTKTLRQSDCLSIAPMNLTTGSHCRTDREVVTNLAWCHVAPGLERSSKHESGKEELKNTRDVRRQELTNEWPAFRNVHKRTISIRVEKHPAKRLGIKSAPRVVPIESFSFCQKRLDRAILDIEIWSGCFHSS